MSFNFKKRSYYKCAAKYQFILLQRPGTFGSFWSVGNVLYFDWDSGYMGISIYQNSPD